MSNVIRVDFAKVSPSRKEDPPPPEEPITFYGEWSQDHNPDWEVSDTEVGGEE